MEAYNINHFNFKIAESKLMNGEEIRCLRTQENIKMKGKEKIVVNFVEYKKEEFIQYYKDEIFYQREK